MSTILQRLNRSITTRIRADASSPPAGPELAKSHFPPIFSWFQTAGHAINDRGIFVGCPLALFELTARDPICLALMEGLKPDSSVLEIGCGCLRVGYWFVQFLNAGRYCGVEPNTRMLDAGRELLLGPMEGAKQPRFSHNDQFQFGEFQTTFDYVIAFSIWTHAPKIHVAKMLDEFQKVANPGAKLITTWLSPRPGMPDYQGTSWVGRSHQSDEPGCVAHSQDWIRDAAASRGLKVDFFEGFVTVQQNWAVFSCR